MTHILNKIFEQVVCINLINRNDKKIIMQEKFNNLGINVEWCESVTYGFAPQVVKSIVGSKVGEFNLEQPNELGAALSHYTVI